MLKLMILSLLSLLSLLLYADAPVVKTGQTTIYKAGDDGTYRAGLNRSYSRNSYALDVVTDHATGLQWQDDANPQFMTWSAARTYCTQRNVNGTGWRLPTKRELETLVDYSQSGSAIDATFTNMAGNYTYWSSTPYRGDATKVGVVTYHNGYSQSHKSKSDTSYVRCVK